MIGKFPALENLLKYLERRTSEDWIVDRARFYLLTEDFWLRFTQLSQEKPFPKILLIEEDPLKFLAAFLAAVAANCHVFLGNPQWQQQELQQIMALVQPDYIAGNSLFVTDLSLLRTNQETMTTDRQQKIMIPTGGSSGKIRFAIHNWETLTASVKGFCQHFEVDRVNSFCVLPLYHVSGLMQFLRSFLTQGNLIICPYKSLKAGEKTNIDPQDFFISLVPTQLQFLLQTDSEWLSQFATVLLGGAPAWRSLLQTARKHQIKLALTYGMTETASQVATLKPEEFLSGNDSSGRVLPHAEMIIKDDFNGAIAIKSESLFLGYYPDLFPNERVFQTDDIGYFDNRGYLYIVGRNSQKIITGGENVFPAEVEAAILATQLVIDVAVIGLPDETWGQIVTALYVPKDEKISSQEIKVAIEDKIGKFKHPKSWIAVTSLQRNSQGKIEHQKLPQLAIDSLR
jgi:o-succinylbenzoate---CoA ligase